MGGRKQKPEQSEHDKSIRGSVGKKRKEEWMKEGKENWRIRGKSGRQER